ncbi:MAG TPA: gamma-glutamyltransferase, partial [Saprospiraceae bacterium]|nr:gamma-glutamyltransferase [Saprospiraceae bacterium]
KAGKLLPEEHEQTTHFSVVDPSGNAVATTTTINSAYGSKVIVKGGGFFMNNEMDDFSAKPGVPNQFGLLGNEANAIEPGKRMLSSMTPTIVAKDGHWEMVVGSPGGSTIITSVFQTIVNVTEFGKTGAEAVAAPRFHHQWRPDTIFVEKEGFPADVLEGLRKKGHTVVKRGYIGAVDAIFRTKDGAIELVADPRWDDGVAGE